MNTSRGYMSSSPPILHFGLGNTEKLDSIEVVWDHKQISLVYPDDINTTIEIDYESTKKLIDRIPPSQFSSANLINYLHRENEFNDYDDQKLLPHKLSQNGPKLCVVDLNKDGLEDLVIGGARFQSTQLFIQDSEGQFNFSFQKYFEMDRDYEDLSIEALDIDKDNDQDLYIVSGGSDYDDDNPLLIDRIYLNDGKGGFSKSTIDLSSTRIDGECMVFEDFNGDGNQEIFLGGRYTKGQYPFPAKSLVLYKKDNRYSELESMFTFDTLGLVTDAISTDLDSDGQLDILDGR